MFRHMRPRSAPHPRQNWLLRKRFLEKSRSRANCLFLSPDCKGGGWNSSLGTPRFCISNNKMTKITWLGHGTVQFQFDSGEVLVLDPWLENPKYPKGHTFQRVDAIAVSHGHFDHIHDVVPLAKKHTPKVVAIFETTNWLESKGVSQTIGMN